MTIYYNNFLFKRKNLGKLYIYVIFLICSFPVFGSAEPSELPFSGFKENKGQITDQFGRVANNVLFQASLPGLNVWITEEGLKYELFREVTNTGLTSEKTILNHEWCRIDMLLKGARISKENVITKGLGANTSVDNYFLSHAPDGVFDVLSYQQILFEDIYPGIDWEILFDGNKIKYNFIVKPHANPNLINIVFNGSGTLNNTSKDLIFETKFGELADKGLRSYQTEDIPCHYVVTDLTSEIYNGYSKKVEISLDEYNTNDTLFIDPELVWGTYFGGNGTDRIRSSVIDANNNLFVTGSTTSTNFPVLNPVNPGGVYYDGSYATATDIFVSKFNAANQLIWSTYYGSTGQDVGNAIDVNSNGDVYVVGETNNNAFPLLDPGGGAWYLTYNATTSDAILIRFTNAGVRVWATYLGASTIGSLQSIAIDASDNVFCVGYAQAIGTTNPGGSAYIQAYAGTGTNGSIYKFSSTNVLIWRTQYGGSGGPYRIHSIDLDPSGNVFITGYGSSSNPAQLNPGGAFMQTATVGNQWSFVAKFSNAGVRLWHTRFGGSTPSTGTGTIAHTIHCDASGNIFLAGITNQTDFGDKGLLVNPGGSSYYDASHNGGDDFFLMKFNPSLQLVWGTYFGSAGTEGFGAISGDTRERELITDAFGNLFFTGRAGSLATVDPGCFFDGTNAGGITESFIARFSNLNELTWSTFLGTSDASIQDCGASMSFDANGYLFWVGELSPSVPASYLVDNGGYYLASSGGNNDGFIIKFSPSLNTITWTGATSSDPSVASNWSPVGLPCTGTAITIPVVNTNYPSYTNLTISSGGSLTLQSGAQLTVTGVLTNNGTMTIKSGATLVQGTSGTSITGSGTYNVQKFLSGNSSTWNSTTSGRFWYMSVPMNSVARSSFGSYGSTTNRIWSYAESTKTYSEITVGTTPLVAGTGYVHRRMTNDTLSFSATGANGNGLFSSDFTLNGLTRTAGSFAGYHLIANPYMAYLDWDAVTKTNVETTYYIRSASPSDISALISYNSSGPNYVSNGVLNIDDINDVRYIAPMQAIWVRVGTASATGSLGMTRGMLSHQSSNPGLKNTTVFPTLARVNLVDGARFDQMLVFMNQDMSNAVDQYDSEKMFVSGVPQIYTMAAGKKLVMNGLKNNKKKISVPLYLELPESKVYNLQLAEYILEDGLILLEDKQEGIIQDFTIHDVYPFYANSGVLSNRFVLHFFAPDNGITAQGPSNSWVENETSYTEGGQIVISADGKGKVQITLDQPDAENNQATVQAVDANGRVVYSGLLEGLTTEIHLDVPSGVYYLTVQSGNLIEKKKVFIQE